MQRLFPEDWQGLRKCVQSQFAGMPREDLEQVVESAISGLPATSAKNFMQTLGSLGQPIGPTLQRAAPGIAQGAATGASVGGPWGALIGAGAGLASAALSGQGKPPTAAAVAPTGASSARPSAPVTPGIPGTPGMPATPALPPGQEAAATLLGLFRNPTVLQALMSQVLGASGSQQVTTASGTTVPRGAINSLLTQLLANATEGLPESEAIAEQSYLQGESGEYLVDPASPEQQAVLVLSRLQPVRQASFQSGLDESLESAEWMLEAVSEMESADWPTSNESAETVQFY